MSKEIKDLLSRLDNIEDRLERMEDKNKTYVTVSVKCEHRECFFNLKGWCSNKKPDIGKDRDDMNLECKSFSTEASKII